jgi:hypothetical protein
MDGSEVSALCTPLFLMMNVFRECNISKDIHYCYRCENIPEDSFSALHPASVGIKAVTFQLVA